MQAGVVAAPATSTSASGTPRTAGPPSGLCRPTALTERPATPRLDSNSNRSMALMSGSALRPFAQAERSLLRDGPQVLAQGPFPGRISVHGLQAVGGYRDNILEATALKPRAMLMPAPVKVENSRPTARTEPRTIEVGLTRHDLQKWPCRRCHFVHKGGGCETSCIGCGSKWHDKHNLNCPFKNKVRQDDNLQIPVKKEPISFRESPGLFKAPDPHISSTMQLSLECQRRGFNPEFKYYRGRDDGDNRADLLIKDVLISGGGVSYKSQKDARDALAPKGLEVVRNMGYGPVTGRPDTGRIVQGASVAHAGSKSTRSPPSVLGSGSKSQGFPYRQPEKRAGLREMDYPVMDLIKSAQSLPTCREPPANVMVSSTSTESKRLGPSQQPAHKHSVVVELPGNIESHAARATVERAVAANPQTNISLHFPANVSVEVAQAYGLAISTMASSSRRRSRSRSPVREVQRDHRCRDRERERERDFYRSRAPVWPPRASTDAYRPSPHAVPRHRVEDSRLRLSPPPESKYYPPHDRRDRYSRDELHWR